MHDHLKTNLCHFFSAFRPHVVDLSFIVIFYAKTTVLNEKKKTIMKRKYMEISLYTTNIFNLGQKVMLTKHTLTS